MKHILRPIGRDGYEKKRIVNYLQSAADPSRLIDLIHGGENLSSEICDELGLTVTSRSIRKVIRDIPHIRYRKMILTQLLISTNKIRLSLAKKYIAKGETLLGYDFNF